MKIAEVGVYVSMLFGDVLRTAIRATERTQIRLLPRLHSLMWLSAAVVWFWPKTLLQSFYPGRSTSADVPISD